jgi:hypothetical protein
MPVVRYFVFVGGALLALLLIANACLPALPVGGGLRSASGVDLSLIRIHSDRKWPERVVFDTSHPTIMAASAPPVTVAAVQPAQTSQKTASAAPLKGQLREAYAQLRPNPGDLRNPKRKRKSVARNHVGPQRMLVAQQRPAFLFGNNIW